MEYKAVTRFKLGPDDEGKNQGYIERGDSFTPESDEEAQRLLASGSIMEADQFDRTFPEVERGENQPSGTPSNLEQIEGTTLQAQPEVKGPESTEPPVNPADPPHVEGATPAGEDSPNEEEDDEEDNNE